jgi:predicted AAA+ superfamily ATPase
LAIQARISVDTVKKLIHAFEALFLIRLIPDLGKPSRVMLLWEDVGLLHHISEGQLPKSIYVLNSFFQNIRCSLKYPFGAMGTFYFYRTRGGAHVPLVFKRQSETYGWILLETHEADRSSLASAKSFLTSYKNGSLSITGPNLENVQLSSNLATRQLFNIL